MQFGKKPLNADNLYSISSDKSAHPLLLMGGRFFTCQEKEGRE